MPPFMNVGVPGMTLELLCLIAALTVALIRMFCALEQSPQLARLRTALGKKTDRETRRH